jgi:hypothetical protein
MMKKSRQSRIHQSHHASRLIVVPTIGVIFIASLVFALGVYAKGFSASFELESATLTNGATINVNSHASSGRYLVFDSGPASVIPAPVPAPTPAPVPAPVPAPTPAPTPGTVKPDGTNTGVPAGTRLTVHNGNLTIDTPGAVIDSLDIRGFVKVNAPNVLIKNTLIRGTTTEKQTSLLLSASDNASVTIQDSELYASYHSWWIDGIRGWNITIKRVNIHDVIDSVHIYGNNVSVESSWLHDNVHYDVNPYNGGDGSHDDGVQIQVGNNIKFVGNNISGAYNAGVQFTQDNGIVSNVQFTNNWLDGGGCTINIAEKGRGPFQGLVFADNIFGRNTRVNNCAIIAPSTTVPANIRNYYTDGTLVTVHRG